MFACHDSEEWHNKIVPGIVSIVLYHVVLIDDIVNVLNKLIYKNVEENITANNYE